MNDPLHHSGNTIGGTVGGTMLVILLQIHNADVIKTCILAAIGAVVSYLVSLGMKWLVLRINNYCKLRKQNNRTDL